MCVHENVSYREELTAVICVDCGVIVADGMQVDHSCYYATDEEIQEMYGGKKNENVA